MWGLLICRLSFVFARQYGWNEAQVGLAFLGLGSGSLLGLYVVYLTSDKISKALTKRNGVTRPEVHTLLALLSLSTASFCYAGHNSSCQ
jgi:hypothetical protein